MAINYCGKTSRKRWVPHRLLFVISRVDAFLGKVISVSKLEGQCRSEWNSAAIQKMRLDDLMVPFGFKNLSVDLWIPSLGSSCSVDERKRNSSAHGKPYQCLHSATNSTALSLAPWAAISNMISAYSPPFPGRSVGKCQKRAGWYRREAHPAPGGSSTQLAGRESRRGPVATHRFPAAGPAARDRAAAEAEREPRGRQGAAPARAGREGVSGPSSWITQVTQRLWAVSGAPASSRDQGLDFRNK